MTDLRQAAQQALEALEGVYLSLQLPDLLKVVGPITALREALAQPEQEPTCPECKATVLYECVACSSNNYPPKPEQKPVAIPDCEEAGHADGACGTSECLPSFRRKTTPPAAQHPWVGLTEEDVNRESAPITSQMKLAFHAGMYVAQKILKERNT